MSVGSLAPGPSGDISMSIIMEADESPAANKERRCNGYCIGKTIIKVTVPSLIIGGLIAGAIFYGVTRIEGLLKDQIVFAVAELKGDLQGEITKVMDSFNLIIAEKAAEISLATSAAVNEGVRLLNNSIQTSFQELGKNLTEAIANTMQRYP